MTVVMVGNLSEGFRVVGPFADFDSAADWCDGLSDGWGYTWVMTLEEV